MKERLLDDNSFEIVRCMNERLLGSSNIGHRYMQTNNDRKVKQFYSDKTGHIKICYIKFKKDWKNVKETDQGCEEKNVNFINYGNDLVVITSYDDGCFGKIDSSSLIVDSGASFHTTSHIELFTIYNSDNFGMMKMRNGNESRVVSVGNVHMVISLSHKLILNNVRHILNL